LDRAAWRRFQVRVQLKLPTHRELTSYLQEFLNRFGGAIGTTCSTLAKELGRISYADAEQFCLDVKRRQILTSNEKSLKQIVAEQVRIWAAETRAQQPTAKEKEDADTTVTSSSRS
jgi:AAA+ superfamily predicted ATPase